MQNQHRIRFSSKEAIDDIFLAKKTYTFRFCPEGSPYHDFKEGELVQLMDQNSQLGLLKITSLSKRPFSELPLDFHGHEKYESLEEMSQVFKEMYQREFSDGDPFVMIGFEVVKKTEKTGEE